MVLDEVLAGLRRGGCLASAVISRDGLVIAADLPQGVSQETFSIMCAAMMGAGITAASELRKASPRKMVLESPDLWIVIYVAGRKYLVVAALPPRADLERLERAMPSFLELVERYAGA
jgi:predicted regulator of Ras-like GTPase activity (Roadblock/LC7/MglB family)